MLVSLYILIGGDRGQFMAIWKRGQPWRPVRGLDTLLAQTRSYAPRAIPPATPANAWGALADGLHSTRSKHYPAWFGWAGTTAVCRARDFPHAPELGLDGHVITEHMRIARDPRVNVIIFDGRITGRNHRNALGLWVWDDYHGSDDMHRTHYHVDTVDEAIADDPRAWSLPGGITTGGTAMTDGWDVPLGQGKTVDGFEYPKQFPRTAVAWTWIGVNGISADTKAILAGQAASAQREGDMLTAVASLATAVNSLKTGGTSIDTKAITDLINARTLDVTGRIGTLEAALQAKAEALADALIGDDANALTDADRTTVAGTIASAALGAQMGASGTWFVPDAGDDRTECTA